ncbi:MAG: HAD-IC family P-type ATPase [bacterium]
MNPSQKEPATSPPANWHARQGEETLKALNSTTQGLSIAAAAERLEQYGPNVLAPAKVDGPLTLIWRQINNPISWLLIGAGVIAVLLRKYTDSGVVFGAVVINAIIGFIQEHRAGKAIAALSAMVPENATVLRDERLNALPAADLVPGDIVQLTGGDRVPADLRLLQVKNLRVDESALTGESVPTLKDHQPVAVEAVLGDRLCMAYGGTVVTQGTATGVVVATGSQTELGHINTLLNQTPQLETPLTQQLAQVTKWITIAVLGLSVILFGYGVLVKHAKLDEALLTAITLAVAAIPEGLPAIITIALAIGVRRMASRRAVVRHLPAVETLGSTSVICSDKTGTLTRNEMTVQALWCDEKEYRLSGVGYIPTGSLECNGQTITDLPAPLRELLLSGVLCNDSELRQEEDQWTITGDPTEAALVVAGQKVDLQANTLRQRHARVDVLPFESETKYMATLNRGEGINAVYLKGAPEMVVARCGLSEAALQKLKAAQHALAEQGMRVLAFAARTPAPEMTELTPEWAASGFTMLGLMGMIDPPRQEAIDAIAICHRAGITVKMITGDHHVTATAIGHELGILKPADQAMRGVELDSLTEEELIATARRCHVFARVAPEHKLKLVRALQADGNVVAMTGDGVNDAPALKRADIGIAMGITGTAVAKDASKVVLADDNFASIAAAVEEGRRVYDNLVKALAFILPTNLSLALTLASAMFFFPTVIVMSLGTELLLPMAPSQILWINLVASVALSAPIAFEVLEPSAMRRKPRPKGTPIFSRFIFFRTALVAIVMAAGTCALFLGEYILRVGGLGGVIEASRHAQALAEAQTMAVTAMTLFQIFYLLHCRSLRDHLGSLGWFSNPAIWIGIGILLLLQGAFTYLPFMQLLFHTTALDLWAWARAALVAAVILPVISLEKWILNRRN